MRFVACVVLIVCSFGVAGCGSTSMRIVNPESLALSLSDLPAGYTQTAAKFSNNPGAVDPAHVSLVAAKSTGALAYVTEFSGVGSGGTLLLMDVVIAYPNNQVAHTAFLRLVALSRKTLPHVMSTGVLGDERRGLSASNTAGVLPMSASMVLFRRGSTVGAVFSGGVTGAQVSNPLFAVAQVIDGRMKTPPAFAFTAVPPETATAIAAIPTSTLSPPTATAIPPAPTPTDVPTVIASGTTQTALISAAIRSSDLRKGYTASEAKFVATDPVARGYQEPVAAYDASGASISYTTSYNHQAFPNFSDVDNTISAYANAQQAKAAYLKNAHAGVPSRVGEQGLSWTTEEKTPDWGYTIAHSLFRRGRYVSEVRLFALVGHFTASQATALAKVVDSRLRKAP
jgi:hypothetical protein